ncbi:Pantoate kinase [Candidatus Gugararchaeum adminiculabundum]|nr:Pantoate kinase [Candidatus Gugararchaeum adminiculabundum]
MATAFSPCSITGLFRIHENGSSGASIVLGEGVTTTVEKLANKEANSIIKINGNAALDAPTSRKVLEKFSAEKGYSVSHETKVPIGFGLGTSGAGALSLALALNAESGDGLTFSDCLRFAAESEIEAGTGLGTVYAEAAGGLVFRKSPGEFLELDKIDISESYSIVCGFLEPIPTAKIIRDEGWKKKINSAGEKYLGSFLKETSIENFMANSRKFAFETGLPDEKIKSILEKEKDASMAMLGKTVFTITKEDPRKIAERYGKFSKSVLIAKPSNIGASVIP